MAAKRPIKIELSPKEEALVHYESEWGRNESIKRQARILYQANIGTGTMKEICEKTGYDYETITRVLRLYETLGVNAIYQCKRGKRINDSYLNADSVCEGLEKLRKKHPKKILYIILDNAAYQRCNKVAEKARQLNINLVFLPPYAPNLNLIERLWKFLRKVVLSNKYYHSFSDFFQQSRISLTL